MRFKPVAALEALRGEADDPELYGKLSELHAEAGNTEQAERDRRTAKAGYERLLAEHPEAYSDHGSEFFRGPGADPERALELALFNLENRPTDRAYELALGAALDAGASDRLCELAEQAVRGREPHRVGLLELLDQAQGMCR